MSTRIFAVLALLASQYAVPVGATDEAEPEFPSPEWTQRELENYARTLEAPAEQVAQPAFLTRLLEQSLLNSAALAERNVADPSWTLASSQPLLDLIGALTDPGALGESLQTLVGQIADDPENALALSLNTPLTPLCTSYALQCAGDPFRYPGFDAFYAAFGEREPVVFYDRGCARISGHVWRPATVADGQRLPGVVIENGSIQAPETLYWWFAQTLVRNGYTVLTFDPRGQGRSDFQTPNGEQGGNINPAVFWEGLVDAVDFFRSTPEQPYPHNVQCVGTYPTPVAAHNPFFDVQDRSRLGIAGHSLGATGVSVVQSYGAPGAEPWPGMLDDANPVDVAIGWDSLSRPSEAGDGVPAIVPRVPAMGQSSEYGIFGGPMQEPPYPQAHLAAFRGWQDAGVPVYQFTIRGSTHFEWSLIPTFPATSWCPDAASGRCGDGWGQPMAEHYSLAWMDRWLKQPGEPGFDDADDRLLADDDWRERFSFYFDSARDYPTRAGVQLRCEELRGGCTGDRAFDSSGGSPAPVLLWPLLLVAGLRAAARGTIDRRGRRA